MIYDLRFKNQGSRVKSQDLGLKINTRTVIDDIESSISEGDRTLENSPVDFFSDGASRRIGKNPTEESNKI